MEIEPGYTVNMASFWSALATAPTSASAGAKEASNFTEFCFVVVFVVSNHRTTTSRHTRKLKFGMQAYFNPTRRNIKKKIGVTCPPPIIGLSLKLAVQLPGNLGG